MLSLLFRRSYSTIPHHAAAARTASTPLAVRLRRQQKRKRKAPVPPLQHDATEDGLTPSELARYRRLLAKGELIGPDGEEPTESEWLADLDEKRSRIRGVRPFIDGEGKKQWRIVGQRIYLPNIYIRMVPNKTPPGQAYNPFEATFRIPQSMTKTDIRSYLANIYGVKTTYIRTDNYFSPLYRILPQQKGGNIKYKTRSSRTYKRAVVGLVEPFYFPQALEDMEVKERQKREDTIEETYAIEVVKREQKLSALKQTKKSSGKGWNWRGDPLLSRRGAILKIIAQRRTERDAQLKQVKEAMLEARTKGELSIVPDDESVEERPGIERPK